MKATKLLFLLALALILGCTDDDLSNQANQELPASLRFNFLVNSNLPAEQINYCHVIKTQRIDCFWHNYFPYFPFPFD